MSYKFSIVTGFRNREVNRVKNSLDSLASQSIQDFELLFIDYGSDLETADDIKSLVEIYPFTKYIYNDTRGWFWNRAHALNTGIRLAKGEITVLWDIDLIVENDFLEKLSEIDFEQVFTTHNCYYLPKGVNLKDDLNNQVNNFKQAYVGLVAVKTEFIQKIKGFDEFYQVWGVEDEDLISKFSESGLIRRKISADEITVYHQWHPSQNPSIPDPWYLAMVNHYCSGNNYNKNEYGIHYTVKERPALKIFLKNDYSKLKKIDLNLANKTLIYNNLIKEFHHANQGEKYYFRFKPFDYHYNKISSVFIELTNKIFNISNINIRLINTHKNESNNLSENVFAFLKLFIGLGRKNLKDYHVNINKNEILLIVIN